MVVVQVVTSEWTKKSRGQPGAQQRSEVPEGFPVDLGSPQADVVLSQVAAAEWDDWAARQTVQVLPSLPLHAGGVRIDAGDDGVQATRLADFGAFANRGYDRTAFRLQANEWGRILLNYRAADEGGWRYKKVAVNVALLDRFDALIFTTSGPVAVLDEQQPLR